MQEMTPRQIVEELDRYIIGQAAAKRAVAVAIRNRWRRRQLEEKLAAEVYPKNIVMIGPTGVGKTEIARRLARLANAPFIKVEASKFTEVGYHGRDVESMIRDLLDHAIQIVRQEQADLVKEKAEQAATDRLVALLVGGDKPAPRVGEGTSTEDSQQRRQQLNERMREQLEAGKLEEKEVDITTSRKPAAHVMFANMGVEQMDPDMANLFDKMIPEQQQSKKVTVARARRILIEQETDKLLDQDRITEQAIARTQDSGIVFLDEVDKIATGSGEGGGGKGGPDVSRQGVQRDLLPIVEGSAVTTRHGIVHTDHILFIAAGAFHSATVSDLMPELQGRFPIRVELDALTRDDFVRILTEPRNALTRQQEALMGVEGITVTFDDGAIDAMAELAAKANERLENIGARRLMTIVEKVFEEVSFDAPDRAARGETSLEVTAELVHGRVDAIVEDEDLSRYVL